MCSGHATSSPLRAAFQRLHLCALLNRTKYSQLLMRQWLQDIWS
jgi:hypothetical protein